MSWKHGLWMWSKNKNIKLFLRKQRKTIKCVKFWKKLKNLFQEIRQRCSMIQVEAANKEHKETLRNLYLFKFAVTYVYTHTYKEENATSHKWELLTIIQYLKELSLKFCLSTGNWIVNEISSPPKVKHVDTVFWSTSRKKGVTYWVMRRTSTVEGSISSKYGKAAMPEYAGWIPQSNYPSTEKEKEEN